MRIVFLLFLVVAGALAGISEDESHHEKLRRKREERKRLLEEFHGSPLASMEKLLSAARVAESRRTSSQSPSQTTLPSSTNGNKNAVVSPSNFKSARIFDGISAALEADGKDLVKEVKGIFAFKVKGDKGREATWIVDAKNGKGKVEFNGKAKPDVTFKTSDSDLFDLMTGELSGEWAFFTVIHPIVFFNVLTFSYLVELFLGKTEDIRQHGNGNEA